MMRQRIQSVSKPAAGIWLLSCLALSSCALPGGPPSGADSWALQRQREWSELNRMKSELRWHNDEQVTREFPGAGTVTVRSWWLEGGPGWEYVRASFTYENTTGEPMERVDVELHVLDPDGEVVTSARVGLTHPWGRPLAPGMCFSDEIRVPTGGAHLNEAGWRWTVECRARAELSGL